MKMFGSFAGVVIVVILTAVLVQKYGASIPFLAKAASILP